MKIYRIKFLVDNKNHIMDVHSQYKKDAREFAIEVLNERYGEDCYQIKSVVLLGRVKEAS